LRTCASFKSLIGIPIVLVMMSDYIIYSCEGVGEVAVRQELSWGCGRYRVLNLVKIQKMRLGILKLITSAIRPPVHQASTPSQFGNSTTFIQDMEMNTLNISATLNVFRLLTRPTLCLPHATISTFNQLPIPLNSGFGKYKNVDIRAVVLDKDNCFAYPKENEVHKPYEVCPVGFVS